ncbi:MAG: type II toxin-antitoxin system RelE/ParE family toxin [Zoogloeaceae bacterium]|jgi:proteic killer suppression protein|nr:type II toxin-antitoxin system RelE/ParE family toxin [Zoogloeaceae bacterium]
MALIYPRFDKRKQKVYKCAMIKTFANEETESFWETGKSRRFPHAIHKRATMRLLQLAAAVVVEDMRVLPSNHLEALKNDRAGQWSIRINGQGRICFAFLDGNAFDVEIVDYH